MNVILQHASSNFVINTSLVKLNWRSLPQGTLRVFGRKDSLFRLSLGLVIKHLMMHVRSQVILSIMIMKLFKNSVQTRGFWKFHLCILNVHKKHFLKMELLENNDVKTIAWFSCLEKFFISNTSTKWLVIVVFLTSSRLSIQVVWMAKIWWTFWKYVIQSKETHGQTRGIINSQRS